MVCQLTKSLWRREHVDSVEPSRMEAFKSRIILFGMVASCSLFKVVQSINQVYLIGGLRSRSGPRRNPIWTEAKININKSKRREEEKKTKERKEEWKKERAKERRV